MKMGRKHRSNSKCSRFTPSAVETQRASRVQGAIFSRQNTFILRRRSARISSQIREGHIALANSLSSLLAWEWDERPHRYIFAKMGEERVEVCEG